MKQSWVRVAAAVLCLTVAIQPSAINGQDVVGEAKSSEASKHQAACTNHASHY